MSQASDRAAENRAGKIILVVVLLIVLFGVLAYRVSGGEPEPVEEVPVVEGVRFSRAWSDPALVGAPAGDGFVLGPTRTPASAPACDSRSCNNYLGPLCRPFSSWLLPASVQLQVGCTRSRVVQIGTIAACACSCATGGAELYAPCRVELVAAPEVSR